MVLPHVSCRVVKTALAQVTSSMRVLDGVGLRNHMLAGRSHEVPADSAPDCTEREASYCETRRSDLVRVPIESAGAGCMVIPYGEVTGVVGAELMLAKSAAGS